MQHLYLFYQIIWIQITHPNMFSLDQAGFVENIPKNHILPPPDKNTKEDCSHQLSDPAQHTSFESVSDEYLMASIPVPIFFVSSGVYFVVVVTRMTQNMLRRRNISGRTTLNNNPLVDEFEQFRIVARQILTHLNYEPAPANAQNQTNTMHWTNEAYTPTNTYPHWVNEYQTTIRTFLHREHGDPQNFPPHVLAQEMYDFLDNFARVFRLDENHRTHPSPWRDDVIENFMNGSGIQQEISTFNNFFNQELYRNESREDLIRRFFGNPPPDVAPQQFFVRLHTTNPQEFLYEQLTNPNVRDRLVHQVPIYTRQGNDYVQVTHLNPQVNQHAAHVPESANTLGLMRSFLGHALSLQAHAQALSSQTPIHTMACDANQTTAATHAQLQALIAQAAQDPRLARTMISAILNFNRRPGPMFADLVSVETLAQVTHLVAVAYPATIVQPPRHITIGNSGVYTLFVFMIGNQIGPFGRFLGQRFPNSIFGQLFPPPRRPFWRTHTQRLNDGRTWILGHSEDILNVARFLGGYFAGQQRFLQAGPWAKSMKALMDASKKKK